MLQKKLQKLGINFSLKFVRKNFQSHYKTLGLVPNAAR